MECWHTDVSVYNLWLPFGYVCFSVAEHIIGSLSHKLAIIITFVCVLVWLIRMFRYNNLMCLLLLTSMIFLWLQVCIFGKAHLCEVSNFCTMFTLILLSQAIKSLCM